MRSPTKRTFATIAALLGVLALSSAASALTISLDVTRQSDLNHLAS
jgi:hypothetical protein